MNRDGWERAGAAERSALATRLLDELPAGFAFDRLTRRSLGGEAAEVADFSYDGCRFVYVPGGEVTVGLEPSGWTPTAEERLSYAGSAEEYGLPESIHEYLASVCLPRRRIVVPSLMVEVGTREPGWREIAEAEARVRLGSSFPIAPGDVKFFSAEVVTRVSLDARGNGRYLEQSGERHADIVREMAPFRLPTSDEWEYLCGGGAATLFRWGDHAPCHLYPTDVSVEEATWRRDWALSQGMLERPAEGFEPEFSLHKQPNAFGVLVSGDPYKAELVAEPDRRRGGDGGCTICGGMGFWLGWLTLATSFFEPELCGADPNEPIDGDYARFRRVLALD